MSGLNPFQLFTDYLAVTGIAHIDPEKEGDPALIGKRLGLINGGSWITLWSNYFGRQFLPGVHLVNVGNEAVQMNFMEAHEKGEATPPQANIDAFCRYALDLAEFAQPDAVLITCSTMNRAYAQVQETLAPYGIPVVSIDRPMMERAVNHDGRVLVVATHGPTVESTQKLLQETAVSLNKSVAFSGLTVHEAWDSLAVGDVAAHNEQLAAGIRHSLQTEEIGCVVLAQLSMTVFLLSYPDPEAEFGVPVFTSGQCGFEYMRELLTHAD